VSTVYMFANETVNFDFSHQQGRISTLWLGTIFLRDDQPAALSSSMAELWRHLARRGLGLDSVFHATTDRQEVQVEVFRLPGCYRLGLGIKRSRSKFGQVVNEVLEQCVEHEVPCVSSLVEQW
jgi:hypothetical protein